MGGIAESTQLDAGVSVNFNDENCEENCSSTTPFFLMEMRRRGAKNRSVMIKTVTKYMLLTRND